MRAGHDEVLAVVEDQEDLPVAQIAIQRVQNRPVRSLSNIEHRGDCLRHQPRIGQGRQVDHPGAVRKAIERARRHLQRQASFAAPARARERQHARRWHELQQLRDFAIASDEIRERRGKVVTRADVVVAALHRRRLAEGVAEAMHGADETGCRRIIAERLADLAHQIREVFLDDEGAGPEPVLQLGLRQCPGVAFDQ